jgi:sulfur-oxidizing protein SoxY
MSLPSWSPSGIERRPLLAGLLALAVLRPAAAMPPALAAMLAEFTGGAAPLPGPIAIDIPPLVENGNAVPVEIAVESPMTEADHIRAIGLFNEGNPLPGVLVARLGPWSGAARISTRMRLATSQRIIAVAARSDGRFIMAEAQVVVTLAACVEG